MNSNHFSDRMVTNDDLIITNKVSHEGVAPHGRLFEVLGTKNGRRIVREIACNTVVVGGAVTALQNLTGESASWQPSTLNDVYGVSATPSGAPLLSLFGVGIGGSNLDFGSVLATDIKQRDVLSPVPLRYGSEIATDEASNYFMKVPNASGNTSSWYLKKFSAPVVIKSCWKNAVSLEEDGTEILADIYNSANTEGIETFAEIQIDLTKQDVREYFEKTGSISSARYNTIGFYTGSLNAEGTEYGDVRLYSVIHFNNRDCTQESSSQFIYRVYSLI